MHFVIVGNGIIALSTAYNLLGKIGVDDSITIVGPSERAGSATLAAAAMLNSFAEIGEHSFSSSYDNYHFELSRRATELWPAFLEGLEGAVNAVDGSSNEFCCPLVKGTYVLRNTASDELDDKNFNAIVGACERFDEPHELLDASQIPNYQPDPSVRSASALLIYNEGWLNPRIVIDLLDIVLAGSSQVSTIDASVLSIKSEGSKVQSLWLDNGDSVTGDIYLLANGAAAGDLVVNSNLGLSMQRVFYGIGVSLEIKAPGFPHKNCIRTPNRGGACGIYTVPCYQGAGGDDDHIIIGASNFISPKPFKHGRLVSVSHLLESAMKEINQNFYDAEVVRINVGWRPTSLDTYPLVGRTSIDNLVIATGTKRDGFHFAPVLSEFIASILCGHTLEDEMEMFRPERPPIRDISREVAIEMGVDSLVSQHYQHGYRPSGIRMGDQYRDYLRQDLEKLHDDVGALDWGIHPEMINMYKRKLV